MKNSTQYSQKVKKLYRSLKRKHRNVQQTTYDEPADAVVCGVISENLTTTEAQSALKKFADYFVDLNDLRVSPVEEIVEVLGMDTPAGRDIASALTKILAAIFAQYNAASLKALKKIGKRPAKQALEKLDGTTHFVVNYCMLMSLQGHAIPLTKTMIEYLKSNGLVDPESDEHEIEGFLTRQISAKNGYEFYALLRCESELALAKSEKKAKRKTTRKARAKGTGETNKQDAGNNQAEIPKSQMG
jgi:endonuclease III